MPRRAEIIHNDNLLLEYLYGSVSVKDMLVWIEETALLPNFHPSINQLVLVDESVTIDLSAEETRNFASLPPKYDSKSRRAYCVANNDFIFASLRMFQLERNDSSGSVVVVHTLEEACLNVGINPEQIFEIWPEIRSAFS